MTKRTEAPRFLPASVLVPGGEPGVSDSEVINKINKLLGGRYSLQSLSVSQFVVAPAKKRR